jgi:hypothetical protein
MFSVFPKTQYFQNKKTFAEQLAMSRAEYSSWLSGEMGPAKRAYELDYRTKILTQET